MHPFPLSDLLTWLLGSYLFGTLVCVSWALGLRALSACHEAVVARTSVVSAAPPRTAQRHANMT